MEYCVWIIKKLEAKLTNIEYVINFECLRKRMNVDCTYIYSFAIKMNI